MSDDPNLIIYILLCLPFLGLFIGALLPIFVPQQHKRLILGLRIAGFPFFAPTIWGFGCLAQSGLKMTPSLWEMFVSALITIFLYLAAVAALVVLRWVVRELIAHYTTRPRA